MHQKISTSRNVTSKMLRRDIVLPSGTADQIDRYSPTIFAQNSVIR